MSVYRFKVSFEDNEEVYREVEIKSVQTFEEFHFIILQSVGFDTIHNASFFISDDYWRKGDEIIYKPEQTAAQKKTKQENAAEKKLMNKCKMATLIDDPHQKFVYVYDFAAQWTFLVELIKILPDDAKITYPRIAKSVDDAPKQYLAVALPALAEEEEEFDEEEPVADDADAYNAKDDDDIVELEAEEGEEEEMDADDMEASDFEEHTEED